MQRIPKGKSDMTQSTEFPRIGNIAASQASDEQTPAIPFVNLKSMARS
jgi:hypothetical protein